MSEIPSNSYNFWKDPGGSQLAKAIEHPQRTTDHHATSRPQQSADSSQCDNTTSSLAAHRTSSEDTTTNSHLRYGPGDQRPHPSNHFPLRGAEPNVENAADQSLPDVSSSHLPYISDYRSAPDFGFATYLTESPPTSPNHEFQFQEEFYPERPINNHGSASHASVDPFQCLWANEYGICNQTIYANEFPEHMRTFHFSSTPSSEKGFKCRWWGCQRSKPYRRDTILRHIREVHRRVPRKAHTY